MIRLRFSNIVGNSGAMRQVYEQVAMIEEARKSFADIIEVADEIIPGHDNVLFSAGRW